MHELLGAHDGAAECGADALMAQANAEDRQLAGKALDGADRDAGLGRRARTGRDHEAVDALADPFGDFVERDLVIAGDLHVGAQFTQVLDDVVGKAVVVVDHQQHGCSSFCSG